MATCTCTRICRANERRSFVIVDGVVQPAPPPRRGQGGEQAMSERGVELP